VRSNEQIPGYQSVLWPDYENRHLSMDVNHRHVHFHRAHFIYILSSRVLL